MEFLAERWKGLFNCIEPELVNTLINIKNMKEGNDTNGKDAPEREPDTTEKTENVDSGIS